MKMTLDAIGRGDCYVARIRGLHSRYIFDRAFIDADERLLPSVNGQPRKIRKAYQLTDGLYEVSESGRHRYLAIVNNRRIVVHFKDLKNAVKACKKYHFELATVYASWAASKRCTSQSFAETALAMGAELRKAEKERKQKAAAERQELLKSIKAVDVFEMSDSALTTMFLKRLEAVGAFGKVAAQLFRCQKPSTRAKVYRGDCKDKAYGNKQKAMDKLCALLTEVPSVVWGWKIDPEEGYAPWVLYVELPQGQVSFHSPIRGVGPDYAGDWDGVHESEDRILEYCDCALATTILDPWISSCHPK